MHNRFTDHCFLRETYLDTHPVRSQLSHLRLRGLYDSASSFVLATVISAFRILLVLCFLILVHGNVPNSFGLLVRHLDHIAVIVDPTFLEGRHDFRHRTDQRLKSHSKPTAKLTANVSAIDGAD